MRRTNLTLDNSNKSHTLPDKDPQTSHRCGIVTIITSSHTGPDKNLETRGLPWLHLYKCFTIFSSLCMLLYIGPHRKAWLLTDWMTCQKYEFYPSRYGWWAQLSRIQRTMLVNWAKVNQKYHISPFRGSFDSFVITSLQLSKGIQPVCQYHQKRFVSFKQQCLSLLGLHKYLALSHPLDPGWPVAVGH